MDKRLVRERLFSEASLSDILRTYESCFEKPFNAYWHCLLAMIVAICIVWPGQVLSPAGSASTYITQMTVGSNLELLAGLGLNLAVGALSVAIAGFAIFASGIDDETLKKMVRLNQSDTKVPVIVYSYASFIYVMVALLILAATSMTCLVVFSEESAFRQFLWSAFPTVGVVTQSVTLCLLLGQLTFVFSILKSFIWNLYQILLSISVLRGTRD